MKLPLESTGTYNFSVDWGDGINITITSWNQPEVVVRDFFVTSVQSVIVLIVGGVLGFVTALIVKKKLKK